MALGGCGTKVRVAVDGGSGRRVLGRPGRVGGAVDSDGGGARVIGGGLGILGQNDAAHASHISKKPKSSMKGAFLYAAALLLMHFENI